MFQRMIAIPQEEYVSMNALQHVKQPLEQQFQQVNRQFTGAEKIQDPYRRLLFQGEALDEMKELKERMRHYVQVSTPKPYVNRAKALFQNVESFLRFNEKGELMDKNNQVISQSRVEDLIQHAVRDRRRNMTPTGWSSFLSMLHEHNIPRSVLNRQTLDELDELNQQTSTVSLERPKMISISRKRSRSAANIMREHASPEKRKSRSRSPIRRQSSRKRIKAIKTDFLYNF